jgi:hypothetical protein
MYYTEESPSFFRFKLKVVEGPSDFLTCERHPSLKTSGQVDFWEPYLKTLTAPDDYMGNVIK